MKALLDPHLWAQKFSKLLAAAFFLGERRVGGFWWCIMWKSRPSKKRWFRISAEPPLVPKRLLGSLMSRLDMRSCAGQRGSAAWQLQVGADGPEGPDLRGPREAGAGACQVAGCYVLLQGKSSG